MNRGNLIEIKCDGDSKIGFGHIRRCLTLKEKLQIDGFIVNVMGVNEASQNIIDRWQISTNVVDKSVKLVVLDSPYQTTDEKIQESRLKKTPSIALDYFGQVSPDFNILIFPHERFRAVNEVYVGYEFVMIRDEILRCKQDSMLHESEKKFVLVAIGGGDILNQGHMVAKYLVEKGLNVTLIRGPINMNKPINGLPSYDVKISPENFPQILAQSDWVVTNGGGTLFEALYLNKSVFVLQQTN